jgi:hypothetical protein
VNREVPAGQPASCPAVPALDITGMPAGHAAGLAFQPVVAIVAAAGSLPAPSRTLPAVAHSKPRTDSKLLDQGQDAHTVID